MRKIQAPNTPTLIPDFLTGNGRQASYPPLRRGEQLASSFFGHTTVAILLRKTRLSALWITPTGLCKVNGAAGSPPRLRRVPEKSLAFPTAPEQGLVPTIAGDSKGVRASRPENPG